MSEVEEQKRLASLSFEANGSNSNCGTDESSCSASATDIPLTIPTVESAPMQNAIHESNWSVRDRIVTVITRKVPFSGKLSPYLVALRPWSFTASMSPVALGTCLAYKLNGAFNIPIFLTTCICALSVHAAGNLVNTYYDYTKGVDSKKSDDRTLVDRLLSTNDVATMGAVSYCVGCVGFLLLVYLSPSPMEHIALVYFGGLSGSFLYTGGLGLKYIALGDIAIFLTFGPLTVLFAYISQGGPLSIVPLLYAIPLALNTEAILHANNTRDMETDKEAGIVTLAILVGKTGSYVIFVLLLFTPYLTFAILATNFSTWFLLPLVTVRLAFATERRFRDGSLQDLPRAMAKLNMQLALCFICACALADKSSLPGL